MSCYQSWHLLVGFILDPLGQLNAVANSSLFTKLPRTLQIISMTNIYANFILVFALPYWPWTVWVCLYRRF